MTTREVAYKILLLFEESQKRLENIINQEFNHGKLSPKDKKNIYNICSGVVRNLSLLDWKTSQMFKGNYKKALNKFKVIMRLALFEIDFQDFIPVFATVNEYVNLAKKKLDKRSSAVVNGILRNYLREKGKYNPEKKFKYRDTQLSVKYSFPEWMIKSWITSFGESETEQLCQAFNQRPQFDIRINEKKITKNDFIQILDDNRINFTTSKYFTSFVKVTDIQKINQLKLFENGLCSVQDESAYLVTELFQVQQDDLILDACSAPGGKFSAILEKKTKAFSLVGMDIFFDRLTIVKKNCIRLGLKNYLLIQSDAANPPFKSKFDTILIDAPCSGLGTIRKNPDIKWRRTEKDKANFHNLQLNLLNTLKNYVKPKGIIVYSTCTINKEENEDVMEHFIHSNKNFVLIPPQNISNKFVNNEKYIRTFPHIHEMDGSFAAILRRLE